METDDRSKVRKNLHGKDCHGLHVSMCCAVEVKDSFVDRENPWIFLSREMT